MIEFNISPLPENLNAKIKYKIDHKTKPLGSLGKLEKIAYQIARIQNSLTPTLSKPHIVVVGSDHRICEEGVSPCPTEITWQQMLNFSNGGGGIGLLTQQYNIALKIVDAGVDYDFKDSSKIIDAKIKKGSGNFLKGSAMTKEECLAAINNGAEIVDNINKNGCNVIAFGEMGIGNTSPASILLNLYTGIPLDKCVGSGSGLNNKGIENKYNILNKAIQKHRVGNNAIDILAQFGGLEIATIVGGMLKAAELKMLIINDGFIITSALLAAHAINSNITDYVIHSHESKEGGHTLMINFLKGEPILDLDLRLGEGTGAALAYPIIEGAVAMLNKMTSFEEAAITDTTEHGESAV